MADTFTKNIYVLALWKTNGTFYRFSKERNDKKQEIILNYGQHKKYKDIIDSNNPEEIKLIQIIMRHFKEDF